MVYGRHSFDDTPKRTKCRISDIGKYYIMYCAYMRSKLGILIGTYSPNHQSIGLLVIHHFSETIRKNNKIIINMNMNKIIFLMKLSLFHNEIPNTC